MNLKLVPKFCPEIQAETVGPHAGMDLMVLVQQIVIRSVDGRIIDIISYEPEATIM